MTSHHLMNSLNGVLLQMDNFALWNRSITSNLGSFGAAGMAILNKTPIQEPAYPEETMKIKDKDGADSPHWRYAREAALTSATTSSPISSESADLPKATTGTQTRAATAASKSFTTSASAVNPVPVPAGTRLTDAATVKLAADIDQWHKDCNKIIADNAMLTVLLWNSISPGVQIRRRY
jgi:hypothetical protein